MFMGLDDVLANAKTQEEREDIKASFIALMNMTDDDIDFSDIPRRKNNFSKPILAKPYLDKIREHNLKIEAMEAEQAAKQVQS